MIRVLHVIGSLGRGGAETYIINLYRHINKNKIQFDFLINDKNKGVYEDEIVSLGGTIYRMEKLNGRNLIQYIHDCYLFFKNHPEIQIVHGHIGSSAAVYLSIAKKFGCYTIAHSHSSRLEKNIHNFFYSCFSYPTRYVADYLFGCSDKAGMARYGSMSKNKKRYSTMYNGIDLDLYRYDLEKRKKIRRELDINEESIVIGTVGRLVEIKNPDKIYEVFRFIINNDNKAVCLWVGDGDKREYFQSRARKEGIGEKILFLGDRNDVNIILNSMDGFILPSFREGIPISLIEAQASGLPCLISQGISEEAVLTNQVYKMDIALNADKWGNKIYNMAVENRKLRISNTSAVKSRGYDIISTAKKVEMFYLHISENGKYS